MHVSMCVFVCMCVCVSMSQSFLFSFAIESQCKQNNIEIRDSDSDIGVMDTLKRVTLYGLIEITKAITIIYAYNNEELFFQDFLVILKRTH